MRAAAQYVAVVVIATIYFIVSKIKKKEL